MHYILTRYEHGGNSGPGSGWAERDEIQVMAASRTERGLRRKQKELGGTIRIADGPYRRYSQNETISYPRG